MRDDTFKKPDSWKRKRRFCFGTRVLRISTLFGILRLSCIKVQKLQKVQRIEKGCGKLIIKKCVHSLKTGMIIITF